MRNAAGRVLLPLLVLATPLSGQWSASVTVEEPAGIRRTSFPTSLRLEIPEGRIEYVSQVRLMDGDDELPSQGTAWSRWPDDSIRELEVDFNISLGPLEARGLELQYGPEVAVSVPTGRALVVSENERDIEVGSVRLNRGGSTLLASVAYREELIGPGRNGLRLVERSGIRRDPREIVWEPVDIVKSGPITVLARYRGRLGLSGGSTADVTLDLEMPNSKSWLTMSLGVSDPDGKLGDVGIETPFRLGAYPWTWDFATPNGSYGAFRDPTGSVIFTRTVDAAGVESWRIVAGPAGSERPYEESREGRFPVPPTWAHLVGPEEAVALAVEEDTGAPGTLTIWLTGTGQTTMSFGPERAATSHALTVYQHYVATPVPIGAATSPASMLSPLRVSVE